MRATRAPRGRGGSGRGTLGGRRFAAMTVLTVLVIASSGIVWASAAGASAEDAEKDYPEVDISKLVVHEFPPGTPQTTAIALPGSTNPLAQDRTLNPGYMEKEFLVEGDASTYSGPVTGPVEIAQTNVPYSTRVLVRYPKDASKFSGRAVVEPFNTSNNGTDLDAVWSLMAPMLQKRGDAWVGVTERTSAGEALKQADPTRYADVNVPSNDVAWDVLAQVGAAIRKGGSQARSRASIPSTSTWPATRRAASTPPGSRSGSRSTTARRRASRCTTDTSRPLTPRASRRSRRGRRCCPSSRPGVARRRRARRQPRGPIGDQGFTAELPAAIQATLGQKEYINVSSASMRRADSDRARRPVPALRGRGHAARAGWRRGVRARCRRSRSRPWPGAHSRS